MDRLGIDLTILTAGELGSDRTYSFPEMGQLFPRSKINFVTNAFIRFWTRMGRKTEELDEGNYRVSDIVKSSDGNIVQAYWAEGSTIPKWMKALLDPWSTECFDMIVIQRQR